MTDQYWNWAVDQVAQSAAWFDEHWPEQEYGVAWYDAVDLSNLDMSWGCACIAGQLGARMAQHEGYRLVSEDDGATRGTNIVLEGGIRCSGFNVLIKGTLAVRKVYEGRDLHEHEVSEFELLELFLKRLEVDHIPDCVRCSFSGSVPNEVWAEEIGRRRRG